MRWWWSVKWPSWSADVVIMRLWSAGWPTWSKGVVMIMIWSARWPRWSEGVFFYQQEWWSAGWPRSLVQDDQQGGDNDDHQGGRQGRSRGETPYGEEALNCDGKSCWSALLLTQKTSPPSSSSSSPSYGEIWYSSQTSLSSVILTLFSDVASFSEKMISVKFTIFDSKVYNALACECVGNDWACQEKLLLQSTNDEDVAVGEGGG